MDRRKEGDAVILALVLVPLLAGILAFFMRADAWRRALLAATALAHAGMTVSCWVRPPRSIHEWLALDALGLLFLSITSLLFLAATPCAIGYLRRQGAGDREEEGEALLFTAAPEAVFTGCLLLFLATMTLVTVCHHLGLLWAAIEATTLASAPLIYFRRHPRSLEATWKYLMICSVGIALALLGNFFMAVAGLAQGRPETHLILGDLLSKAPLLHVSWLKAAFLFLLVGYGTKMGLAPMHTWLPDAHSESPSVVSALLSGALLNCAFLGILRAQQVCAAAGQAAFSRDLLLGFGLLSMGVAAVFVLNQPDYKRMLAYSSVEHMGILAFGVGLGGEGDFGAMFHAVNHSLAKAMLFLVAGNILALYKTKLSAEVRGVSRVIPISGALWIAGLLAISGLPPFGTFFSEFTILKASLDQGRSWVATAYLALLALVFVGMATSMLRMAQGMPSKGARDSVLPRRESWLQTLSPVTLGVAVLILGLWLPPALDRVLHEAASLLGGI